MLRAGIGMIAVACLTGCGELRGEVVFEGIVEGNEADVIACLEKDALFGEAREFGGWRRIPVSSRTPAYQFRNGQLLFLFEEAGEQVRMKFWARQPFRQESQIVIQKCARRQP